MIAVGILWLLAISCATADHDHDTDHDHEHVDADVVPTFTWAAESESDSLIIDFHDGGEPDVAVLKYMHDVFGDDDKDAEDDDCTLTGYLTDEPEVPITVDGCPGNDNFQVIFNSKRIPNSAFEVENGQVTAFHPDSHQMSGSDDDENTEIVDDRDVPEKYRNLGDREIIERSLPSSFEVTLALRYDNLFLNNVCGGDHALAKSRVGKIISLAQTYFLDSATLGTKITLTVKEIEHTDNELKLRNSGVSCDSSCMLSAAGDIAAKNPLDVDNYHFISADNPGPGVWDTAGIARQMGYNGWAIMGSVCFPDQKRRVGISEFWGDPTKWSNGKLNAALTFAHELGHSLGMPHDFVGSDINNPKFDSSGTSCLNVDGIMSYKNTKTTWSTCSKEAITGWFNQLASRNMDCKSGSGDSGGSETATCTDTANGAADNWGDSCPQYAQNKGWCGKYNNAAFQSDKMCCACGGGSTSGGDSGTAPASTDCTPAKSLDTCGNCLTGDQCKEGYCCPYMKKCVPTSSTPCYLPIANCRPMCYDSMDPASCTCANTDFPANWAKPTC